MDGVDPTIGENRPNNGGIPLTCKELELGRGQDLKEEEMKHYSSTIYYVFLSLFSNTQFFDLSNFQTSFEIFWLLNM
jgi:hypothetical protein